MDSFWMEEKQTKQKWKLPGKEAIVLGSFISLLLVQRFFQKIAVEMLKFDYFI